MNDTTAITAFGTRIHQMFPVLTEHEIARVATFGTVQWYEQGDNLFTAGESPSGMFVVLKGTVAISQRDGSGSIVPVVRQGRGQFSGEVAHLSGGHTLVDGIAEDSVEALLLTPTQLRALIIAHADLGERIVRAFILRRVGIARGRCQRSVAHWATRRGGAHAIAQFPSSQ